jgi:hypothetical protein
MYSKLGSQPALQLSKRPSKTLKQQTCPGSHGETGGGPQLTCATGGIPELDVVVEDPVELVVFMWPVAVVLGPCPWVVEATEPTETRAVDVSALLVPAPPSPPAPSNENSG